MKELKCLNCGAPINRSTMRCEYCGAVFKEAEPNNIIYVEHPKVMSLGCLMRIDRITAKYPGIENHIKDEIAYQLAKKVADAMEMAMEEDYQRDEVLIHGRVRVVKPGERIW